MRILITDDEMTSRKILQKLLQPLGACQLAADGTEALKLFIQAHTQGAAYDLITLDLHMEDLGGMTTLNAIRRYEEQMGIRGEKSAKILVVTVSDVHSSILGAFRAGCEGYIVKPVDPQNLRQALKIMDINYPMLVGS